MRHLLYFQITHFYAVIFSIPVSFLKCESSDTIIGNNLSGIEENAAESDLESFVQQLEIDETNLSADNSSSVEEEGISTTITNYVSQNPNTSSDVESHNKNIAQNLIPLPKGYNKLAIPVVRKTDGSVGIRVYVDVSIFVRSIIEIDEKKKVITLDMDFRVEWTDWKIYFYLSGLNFIDPETKQKIVTRTVSSDGLKQIWKPDIFIDEMDSIEKTSILDELVTLQFLDQTDAIEGDIVYSSRNTLKLRCRMDFQYYPADTQTCTYHIRSYSHNETFLVLKWGNPKKEGVYLNDPSDPNFSIMIEGVKPSKNDSRESPRLVIHERFDHFRIGKYTLLAFSIKIRRKLSYHLVQTYLPSVILILITWLCFLLPTNMVEARIGISMTTLLTLTAMFASVRQQSPEVSYSMAIDIWMVFCILCVFVALLLFTLIYWMKRNLETFAEKNSSIAASIEKDIHKTRYVYKKFVRFTKVYAFWALAVTFITFTCIYWVWLLTYSRYYEWDPDPRFNADPLNKTTNLYQCTGTNDNETEGIKTDNC